MKVLEGKKIRLIPIKSNMADGLFEAYAEIDEHCRFMTGTKREVKKEDVIRFCKRVEDTEDGYYFGIEVKSSGKYIGELAFIDMEKDNDYSSFRFGIYNEKNRNAGFGTEALKLSVQFAFEDLNLHRLDLTVFEQNPKAIHMYEKLGFQLEGTYREVLKFNEKRYNGYLMGMLRKEFDEKKAAGSFKI